MENVEINAISHANSLSASSSHFSLLQFTGNWFIDAGILGFANLMEEVYGDLWIKEWKEGHPEDKDIDFLFVLQEKIKNEPKKVYYGYFPMAYLFYHSELKKFYSLLYDKQKGYISKIIDLKTKLKTKKDKRKIDKIITQISKLNSEIEILKANVEKEKIRFRDKISDIVTDLSQGNVDEINFENLIEGFSIKGQQFAKDFALFNPSPKNKFKKDLKLAFLYVFYLLKQDIDSLGKLKKGESTDKDVEIKYEIIPDFTVNPFLVPEDNFPNILYTKPLELTEINKLVDRVIPGVPLYMLILTFQNSFISFYRVRGKYFMFYANNLRISYNINKKINMKIEKLRDDPHSLFRITVSSIIDELVEEKASFSIENMYLVEYAGIGVDQKLFGVHYIHIPKLQASLLVDDTIRERLNRSIPYRRVKKQLNWIWLMEEFIKGQPLYPIFIEHVNLVLNENNENILVNYNTLLYSLIIDAHLVDLESKKENNILFPESFFENYRSLVEEIKEDLRHTSFSVSHIRLISKDSDAKKRLARELLGALRAKNKNMFLNVLLKNLNEDQHIASNKYLNKWVWEKIIHNNKNFERYGLILVANLLRGGKNE